MPIEYPSDLVVAGIDEAGRGCYAGPVYAAAVILPKGFHHPLLNDSKLVKPADREMLRSLIEKESMAWAVASVDNDQIDKTNILKATYRAMWEAVAQLKIEPQLLLIDGNRFAKHPLYPHECHVKGDSKYTAIAAASILAKTHRDAYMNHIDREFEMYGWAKNKGYGTASHREAITRFGLCKYHRKSYKI
jgi:ribonuclease HII